MVIRDVDVGTRKLISQKKHVGYDIFLHEIFMCIYDGKNKWIINSTHSFGKNTPKRIRSYLARILK